MTDKTKSDQATELLDAFWRAMEKWRKYYPHSSYKDFRDACRNLVSAYDEWMAFDDQ